jgi:hypothetical protein
VRSKRETLTTPGDRSESLDYADEAVWRSSRILISRAVETETITGPETPPGGHHNRTSIRTGPRNDARVASVRKDATIATYVNRMRAHLPIRGVVWSHPRVWSQGEGV